MSPKRFLHVLGVVVGVAMGVAGALPTAAPLLLAVGVSKVTMSLVGLGVAFLTHVPTALGLVPAAPLAPALPPPIPPGKGGAK
jgi:hypothetical protein